MKFHKSMTDRRIFGVCGGLAETLKVNANVLRVAFVLLHFLTRMPLFLLYLVLAYVLPYDVNEQKGEEEPAFGGFGQTAGRTEYTPDAPPFDISEAQDVEIDGRE